MPERPWVGVACPGENKGIDVSARFAFRALAAAGELLVHLVNLTSYHAGGELDEDGADDGTEELGDPVEDAGEDGDLAAEGEAEGDGGVDVAAGDVGADGDRDEEPEPVAHRHGDQTRRVKRCAAGQLGCNDPSIQFRQQIKGIVVDRGRRAARADPCPRTQII